MAEKISTLILTVDLDCYTCSKKIKKTICKLQGREQIQAFNFDAKNNTVTISGLFDPHKLKKKLLCKASCKVIKDIKIKEDDKKPPEKIITTQPEKEKEKAKAKPAESEKEKEKAQPKAAKPAEAEKEKEKAKAAKPAEAEKEKEKAQAKAAKPAEAEKEKEKAQPKAAKPAEAEKEKGKAKPAETEKEKAKPAEKEKEKEKADNKPAEPEKENAWAVGPPLPSCCWRPLYEHYYGGCRCCSCGMFFAWPAPPLPPTGVYMGGPPTSTCQFFCEEDPSCTIM